jgi:hypothetical protein
MSHGAPNVNITSGMTESGSEDSNLKSRTGFQKILNPESNNQCTIRNTRNIALMSSDNSRRSPVIIITGTPGTGKSTHAHLLTEESPIPLQHINVGDWVKQKGLHEGYDYEWQSYTVDEDRVSILYRFKVLVVDPVA